MLTDLENQKLGRFLTYLLRHRPDAVGVRLSADGWVGISELLAGIARHGEPMSREVLEEIVRRDDKQRFSISPDGLRIRASQGHSARSGARLSESLRSATPPDTLFHGTKDRFLASIRRKGLLKMGREHVHLSATAATAVIVGDRRKGRTVILEIDAAAMAAGGDVFFLSDNGVWLTHHVPPGRIRFPP